MNHKPPYASGLLALGISVALQTTALAGADAPSASLLMSEAEIAAHRSTMATLEGRARDEYRDAQYKQLQQRAREQGFSLPDQPPWAKAAAKTAAPSAPVTVTTAVPAVPAPAMEAPEEKAAAAAVARHDAMRERLQAQQPAQTTIAPVQAGSSQGVAEAKPPAVKTPTPQSNKAGNDLPAAPARTAPVTEPAPSVPAVTQMPSAPAPLTRPAPPTPPARPATTGMNESRAAPLFAPVEVAPPAPVAPVTEQPTVAATAPVASSEPPAPPAAVTGGADTDNMDSYRANMRTQFDEYMKQRQEQMEENARRQREQHQAEMEKRRAMRANRAPYAPYPFPAAPPSYGPRYPAQYPGYRTPYWQQ